MGKKAGEEMKEVYLFDNEEAIEIRDLETDEMLYKFTYRDKGNKIWDYEDAWRELRHTHLRRDLYKEVFKCSCGKIVRIPEKIELDADRVNDISFDLKCDCGKIITIKCDTLTIEEKE